MQVRDARGRTSVNRDPDKGIAYAGPLAVIVDRNSASASEIFSGAIQDYRRGIIIGEPTYGKGTVQNLINLDPYSEDQEQPLGQLKLTIAQFFRINGESTQHRGIVPDFVLPGVEPDLPYGEKALDNALPFAQIGAAAFSQFSDSALDLQRLREAHDRRVVDDPDFTYLAGLRDLDRVLTQSREVSLLESQRKAERDQREETQQRIFETLKAAHGVSDDADEPLQDLPRDAVLLESARILTDLRLGNFDNRLVVQLVKKDSTPLSSAAKDHNAVGQ